MSVQTILKSPGQRITLCPNPTRKGEKLYPGWQVRESTRGGRPVRRTFALKSDAEKFAKDRAKVVTGQGALLSPADLHSFRAAIRNAYGCGLNLESLTSEAAQAKRELAGLDVSLSEAARYYRAHHQKGACQKTVQEAIVEFIAQRRKEGVSARHLRDLNNRLPRFAAAMQGPLSMIDAAIIQGWLDRRDVGNRTLINDLGAIKNFIGWAKVKCYLPSDFAELAKLHKIKATAKPIGIFRPIEMLQMLRYAADSLLPFLLLGGFAGLRQSEALLLDWDHVDWEDDSLIIPMEGKTGERRVPMEPNLRSWLEPMRGAGRIIRISESGMSKAIERCITKTNRELARQTAKHRGLPLRVIWQHDGLRHSRATYWMRIHNNEHLVAGWMGHTVATLKRDYCNRTVTNEAARAWDNLYPEPKALQLSLFTPSGDVKTCPESVRKGARA